MRTRALNVVEVFAQGVMCLLDAASGVVSGCQGCDAAGVVDAVVDVVKFVGTRLGVFNDGGGDVVGFVGVVACYVLFSVFLPTLSFLYVFMCYYSMLHDFVFNGGDGAWKMKLSDQQLYPVMSMKIVGWKLVI